MGFRFKPAYYWFAIFALTSIAYQLVQDNIRPNYQGDDFIIKYSLGIAPNFFPAIGIPALFVILLPEFNNAKKTNQWLTSKKHITANLISLTGLLTWEFLQTTTARGRFDWNDILWTLIGGLIFQLIWILSPAAFKEELVEAN